ncbi:TPA: hypothetical protein JG832_002466 [Enterobacter hormaechei subsp. xiangfangensis]|nr:hypothetical protein [Enterobacter hormaechei subsp. xiangfangensis]HAV1890601.1 hypothetical protein [Enterobacter hormaechei subsp. xiangfangensis]
MTIRTAMVVPVIWGIITGLHAIAHAGSAETNDIGTGQISRNYARNPHNNPHD